MKNTLPPGFLKSPVHLLATGFGSGAIPYAPGTWGTIAAIPLYLLLQPLTLTAYLAVTGALFALGVWLCQKATRALDVHDHSGIVWDEFVGYLVTMAAAPVGWTSVAAGFVLFRLFDIIKPWPIRWIDRRISGGIGIMLDDVLAGVFAWLSLQALFRFF